jgi:hypothetical protein
MRQDSITKKTAAVDIASLNSLKFIHSLNTMNGKFKLIDTAIQMLVKNREKKRAALLPCT